MSRIHSSRPRPVVLVILDGFGYSESREGNAILQARMPNWTALNARFAHTLVGTSGRDVGLPDGQMGNSEVGHLNFGAGRIAQMDISRIDVAVAEGTLGKVAVVADAIATAKSRGGRLHLLGLVSDGGVHSSIEHLEALIDAAHAQGVEVLLHAFLDGRDTPPRSAAGYLERASSRLAGKGRIATMGGRYWGMDRDQRWDRVARAYAAIERAEGHRAPDWKTALEREYAAGRNDEFVEPTALGDYAGVDPDGRDAALFFNFRPDRAREITLALTANDFGFFDRGAHRPFAYYGCMTQYDASLGLPIAFPKQSYPDIFPEVIARAGLAQFRCAETEKFAHVTYFFNGGREAEYDGEDRKLVPSPKDVATYDKKPEMSAPEVTRAVVAAIESDKYDFILVNYANADMVGHTGVLPAAIAAVEEIDRGVGAIARAVLDKRGALIVTADHGNCEQMLDPRTGEPFTAHTLNPVPLLYAQNGYEADKIVLRPRGRICDVAPTMLQLMDLEKPAAMTGVSLLPDHFPNR